MEKEIFNTLEGISNYVQDLKSLNEIIEARSNYNSELKSFVFNKIVILDSFGQAFILEDMDIKNDAFYKLDKVVTLDMFNSIQKRYSFGGKYVPLFTEKCDQCGETYTLEDLPYLSATWYSRKLMHNGCIGHYYYETERAIFENILKKVYPNQDYALKGIKTEYIYDDKTRHNRPWFKVQTPDGEILIGKRKRVFHIEWKDSYKLFSETFESEDVTKEFNEKERYIHAYSIDNAVKYLTLAKNSIIEGDENGEDI